MQSYGANKLATALSIYKRIENWPSAWDMRLRRKRRGLRLLRFRDGLNVICRGGTRDWDVIHELAFAGSYGRAFDYLRGVSGSKTVLDLGGNIGLFSLMAAAQSPDVRVHAFEPGPPNYCLFEANRLINGGLGERISLHREAVGGANRQVTWFFDESNPGGSGLFGTSGASFEVRISAFADVVAAIKTPITLAKIDIEGAEFEILEQTPAEVWRSVQALSLELHDDPTGRVTPATFLQRMRDFGFRVGEERVCTYFLERT